MSVSDYAPIFEAAGQEWNIDPHILRAVAHQESGGDPHAISKAGAQGVMQIMPDTQKHLGVTHPFDPEQSIYAGAKYLSEMFDRFKKSGPALAAYNAGPERVDAYLAGRGSLPAETAAYVPAVSAHYQRFAQAATPVAAKSSPESKTAAPAAKPSPDTVSDDDFLKRTAAPSSSAPKIEPDTDFLARTGAAPAAAPAPPRPTLADAISSPEALAADVPQSQTPNPALDRIAGAVAHGFQSTPPILTPEAQAAVDQGGPVGRYIVNPALRAVGTAFAGVNALASGAAQGVNETTNALGVPALGRDLNMISQVAPVASMGAGVPVPRGVQEAPPSPRFVQEYYGEGTRQNPLAAAPALSAPAFVPPGLNLEPVQPRVSVEPPAFIPPSASNQLAATAADAGRVNPLAMSAAEANAANPLSSRAEPVPQSVGAASRDTAAGPLPTQTRGQERADLMKSVTQTAEDRAGPQGVDHTTYVPGVQRTLAGREFTPQNAVDEKVLRETDPVFDQRLKAIEKANNETLIDHFRSRAGDDIAIENAERARDALTPPALKLFENEKPVDAAPVVAAIDEILAGPAGKRSSVVSVLKDVRAKMFDQDGNLEKLPSQLYGARQNITDKLRTAAKGTSDEASNARLARAELQSVLEKFDPIIGQGAKGFEAYLKGFSEASKPIEEMRYLQAQLTGAGKITDAQGYLRHAQVQKLLEKIAKDRAASGNNAAKSITPESIQAIIDIRNELAANAYKDRLASTKGSDTTQKLSGVNRLLSSPAGTVVKGAATLGAHYLMAAPTGGVGNALLGAYQLSKPAREARKAARATAEIELRKQALLNTQPPPQAP